MKSALAALLLIFLGGFAPLATAAPAESLERIVHLTDGALKPSAEPPAPLVIQPVAPPAPRPVPSPFGVSAIEDPAAQAHLQQGDQAFAARSYQEALAHYRKAAEVSGSPRIHALLGMTHRKLGHYAQAYDEYRASLASDASLTLERRQQIQVRLTEMLRRQEAFAALAPEASTQAEELAFVSVRSSVSGLGLQTRVVRRDQEDGYWLRAKETWRTVCQEDCNAFIPRHSTLRILGKDVKPAPTFTLPAEDRDVVLHVRPYAKNVRIGAFAMMGTGIVMSLVGVGLMGAFATASSRAVPNAIHRTPMREGLSLFLGGNGVALGSISLFLAARPSVRIE